MSSARTERLKAYRFRLNLTADQRSLCEVTAGHCRFTWNFFLSQRESWYQAVSSIPSKDRDPSVAPTGYNSQAVQLPALKAQFPWLKDAPSQCLQQTLMDLERAYRNFFEGRMGYPKFKRKDGSMDSFRFPCSACIRRRNDSINLPKLGWVSLRNSYKRIRGQIRSVTVSRRGSHWYASVLYKQEVPLPVCASVTSVGLDRNCGDNLCALSNGEIVKGLTPLKSSATKLKRLQRALSRKKKGSSNFKKQRAKIARCHQKIADIRGDLLHKLSHRLSKSHATVVLEDLRVRALSASAKGTIESPGSHIKQKSGLNRSILERGWGELERQLTYKMQWAGGSVVKVNAAYTSQRCACCGHTEPENRNDRHFECRSCGHIDHADINAAKNILHKAAGLVASACGGIDVSRPTKQEREDAVRLPTGGHLCGA